MSKRNHFKDRKLILDRVNNRCELCNSEERIHIHHKDLDRSNNTQENAQVLCQKCHRELHREHVQWGFEDKRIEEMKLKAFGIEKETRAAWVKQGRSLDEIGGQEFNEFFHNYISGMK